MIHAAHRDPRAAEWSCRCGIRAPFTTALDMADAFREHVNQFNRGTDSLRRILAIWEIEVAAGPLPRPTVDELVAEGLDEADAREYVDTYDEDAQAERHDDLTARCAVLRFLLDGDR